MEVFRLSTSVSSCGGVGNTALGTTNASSPETCWYKTPWGQIFFTESAISCGEGIITTPDKVQIGCYYTGSDSNQIFGSN